MRTEMDRTKKEKLEAKGWKFGDAADLFGLSPEEARYIDLKLSLRDSLKAERLKQNVTQVELAKMIGSSQSRVAKMEAGDPSVSVDLLLKALLSLGVTKKQLSKIIA
jgi:DNA-binding XRE family transcriptional regulator